MHLPNLIISDLLLKAGQRSDITAGLYSLAGSDQIAVGKGSSGRLQEPASAVGAAFWHIPFLHAAHKLHIDEIEDSVKVQLFNDLVALLRPVDHVLNVHGRSVNMRVLAQTDAAHKRIHVCSPHLICQRSFSLAFFLFKVLAVQHFVKEPCVALLNKTDILQGVAVLLRSPHFPKEYSKRVNPVLLSGVGDQHGECILLFKEIPIIKRKTAESVIQFYLCGYRVRPVFPIHTILILRHGVGIRSQIKIQDLCENLAIGNGCYIILDPIMIVAKEHFCMRCRTIQIKNILSEYSHACFLR